MSTHQSRKVYVVQEIHWEYNDEYYDPGLPEPVRAFRDRDRAESYRREQEVKARRASHCSNPFHYTWSYELPEISSLTEEEVLARVRQADWLVPDGPPYDWSSWYDLMQANLPESELCRLYDLFDRVRFYEIVEMDLEEPAEHAGSDR
jgi:hypothetical protein